ncbi:hypothetical protein SASPL_114222 [Salvia splendens]|uniref:Nucleolus and neural progenitor protein-like N-terminal domain-containing protein n=1 Tax=Salvia splendens TaxID=180675 RepID=A0A8X8Y3D1_SALSN|nr:hypothetical protein SASPL_114222 [Salvia splendens]
MPIHCYNWIQMDSDIKTVEQRLKSFTSQLHTECGILERLVYKHKNQHRRSSYFQYILKVRRDLQLLKSLNLDEVLESSFLVINGDRPKQKVQLLEGLKRRKTNSGKYNFLERLLGVTRLLSQIVEPLLKAAMYPYSSQLLIVFVEISKLLARSFFMKFSLVVLAVLARVRVLVQQMLLDAVLLYNTVSSLSQKEQSIKLKQEGFEVFREYFPRKVEAKILLECIWQKDKFVLVETTHKREATGEEKDERGDISLSTPQILYENIEVVLGVDDSGAAASVLPAIDTNNVEENYSDAAGLKKDEKNVSEASDMAPSSANIVSLEDVFTNSSAGSFSDTNRNKLAGDVSCSESEVTRTETSPPAISTTSTLSRRVKKETSKKVAFVAVKQPAPSTTDQSRFPLKGTERNSNDLFFNLLTGGNKSGLL